MLLKISPDINFSQTNRVEIFDAGVAKAPRDFWCCDDGRDRMTVAHGLAHRDYIWNDVFAVQLERPHVSADPSEANLHLIRDTDSTGFAYAPKRVGNLFSLPFLQVFFAYYHTYSSVVFANTCEVSEQRNEFLTCTRSENNSEAV